MFSSTSISIIKRWKTGQWSFQSRCQICKKPRTCIEIPPLTGHNEIMVRMIRIVTKFKRMMIMMRIDQDPHTKTLGHPLQSLAEEAQKLYISYVIHLLNFYSAMVCFHYKTTGTLFQKIVNFWKGESNVTYLLDSYLTLSSSATFDISEEDLIKVTSWFTPSSSLS